MKPLQVVYCLRIVLGVVAALLCTGYVIAVGAVSTTDFGINIFMNGLSIAILTYIVSYYLMKGKFIVQVEKPQKVFTMGIGIYFISWLVFWVLLYTMLALGVA